MLPRGKSIFTANDNLQFYPNVLTAQLTPGLSENATSKVRPTKQQLTSQHMRRSDG